MFLYDFVHVERPVGIVKPWMLADHDRWLAALATAAVKDGEELRMRVGLGRGEPLLSKEVRLVLGTAREQDNVVVIPLSWEATGLSVLFPRLEADLEIAPLGATITQITLRGRYEPPLGKPGRLLDEALLHRVAEATARSFLKRLAQAIEDATRDYNSGGRMYSMSDQSFGKAQAERGARPRLS